MLRTKAALGLAACAATAAGLLTATPATAARLPCHLAGSGDTASAHCYSGSSYTWRLVVDCDDVSNPKWPVRVKTLYGAWHTGDGSDSISCGSPLRATGRLEARL
ncbi:hypothetical protein SLUN_17145 [Streptomyces lunaelactis]|uniref:Secreted protein n=1 Tax=Streptomyces lunaelactis TaxID=1535768 RepID=A0A2R4T3B8_9ACTN|nr:hypothetical protein [Streptomyces lunaelactis]AVZ73643.1 hypothetical protein SLUN_17145 [Streptomyces lunaelactis]NUK89631.1 hypothetical protein [Streptomyces lunaelactis]